jgi:O-antigen/teichoic acid export membrane protein
VEYGLAGATGVILARSLGPEGRGLYSLITEAGALVYAPLGLGVASAGVYLSSQRRFDSQTVFSNALLWILGLLAVYCAAAGALLALQGPVLGITADGIAVVVLGGALGLFRFAFRDFLAAQSRMGAVGISDLVFPTTRFILTGILLAAALLGTTSAVFAWLAAATLQAGLSGLLVGQRLRLIPGFHFGALRAQLSFGAKQHLGWLLQSLNQRLDVFLVGFFAGTAAVGHYAVAFNLAEMTWWVPMAVGTALFPRASTLDAKSNADLSALVLRRALPLTVGATLTMALIGQPLIALLYGTSFEESATPFLVLLPSGIFYTIHRILNASLAAQGKPEASLYGGLVSVPIMIGANLALIPSLGATGAALASDIAYGANAFFMLLYFARVSGIRLNKALLMDRHDLVEILAAVGRMRARLTTIGGHSRPG